MGEVARENEEAQEEQQDRQHEENRRSLGRSSRTGIRKSRGTREGGAGGGENPTPDT